MRQRKDQITKKPRISSYKNVEKLKDILINVGICPRCEQEIQHDMDMDDPLVTCGCPGTIEWTSKPPLIAQLRHNLKNALGPDWTQDFPTKAGSYWMWRGEGKPVTVWAVSEEMVTNWKINSSYYYNNRNWWKPCNIPQPPFIPSPLVRS